MDFPDNSPEQCFYHIIDRIYSNWTGLVLAIAHGSSDSKEKSIWFRQATLSWILSNTKNLVTQDIEEMLEDVMNDEFDCLVEDDSIPEIAKLLHKFYHLIFVEKDENQVNLQANFLPQVNQDNSVLVVVGVC